MKIQIALLFSLFFVASTQVVAQELTKEEKKKWVTAAKNFKKDPASLKNLVEERDQFQLQAQEAQTQLVNIRNSQSQSGSRVAQLEQEITRLNQELLTAQEAMNRMSMENERLRTTTNNATPSTPTNNAGDVNMGIIFRVQVGAFSAGRIPRNIQNLADKSIQENGKIQKVLVGNYRNVDDARARAKQLKQQGTAPGAFVVAFRDGERVSMADALR